MKASDGMLWTIDELGAKAAEALAVDYEGPPNDRVRDVPDRRTIRYYTTLGLIDRPAEMRGRTAFYGPKHLMQLAAIKRLQSGGLSLADVQRRLAGLSGPALARLARLPAGLNAASPSAMVPEAPRTEGRAASFWKAAPAPLPESRRVDRGLEDGATDLAPALQGVRLGEGATLLIESPRPVDDEDLEAIRRAAGPLLRLLDRRRLLGPRPGKGDR